MLARKLRLSCTNPLIWTEQFWSLLCPVVRDVLWIHVFMVFINTFYSWLGRTIYEFPCWPFFPYQYRYSHYKDKTVSQPSHLYIRNSYIGKTASLFWIGAQISSSQLSSRVVVCCNYLGEMAELYGRILVLCPANERRRYKVTPSLIGLAQT